MKFNYFQTMLTQLDLLNDDVFLSALHLSSEASAGTERVSGFYRENQRENTSRGKTLDSRPVVVSIMEQIMIIMPLSSNCYFSINIIHGRSGPGQFLSLDITRGTLDLELFDNLCIFV